MVIRKFKINFEHPWFVFTDRMSGFYDDITLYDVSFMTTAHYFKNHTTGFEEILIKLFGFGIRMTRTI